ncbi:MAG: hypothetical protein RR585_05805 [Coprobacillus sp.]
MALPNVHPLLLDETIVLISAAFMECFTPDEQAVIGTFLATLGSVISFNSVYLLYTQGLASAQSQESDSNSENNKEKETDENQDNYDLIRKTVDKLQEEVHKIQQEKH